MSEYAWTCLNKDDSEYASGPKYTKILNMTRLSMCERYTAYWLCQNMPWQSSEYILGSKYVRVLNRQELHRILNMSQYGFIYLNRTWICLVMSEFTIIDWVLNMYHTIQTARVLYNLTLYIPFNPLSASFTKWSNTLKQFVAKLPTNCLSVWPFCEIGA